MTGMKKYAALLAGAAMTLSLGACVTDPVTGKKKISNAAIGGVLGAGGGYLLGDLIGGKNSRTAEIVGAGIGAVAGAGVGYYLDEQEKKLREETAGSGIGIENDGQQLILSMPGDITFDTNDATVKASFYSTLNTVASTLVQYPSSYIDIYGHTDSRGADTYNMTLSQNRAASVQSYLARQGVQVQRLAAIGMGETALKCSPESTAADLQCNRRVEIRVKPITQADVNAAR